MKNNIRNTNHRIIFTDKMFKLGEDIPLFYDQLVRI